VAEGDEVGAGAALPQTGLELVLGEVGIATPRAVVVDPSMAVGVPGAWATIDGYGDHPVSSPFRGRRMTLWLRPRAVVPGPEVAGVDRTVLVRSSAAGWGETDIASALEDRASSDDADLDGPVSVAMAAEQRETGARVVVVGSARSLSSEISGRGTIGNDAFAAGAISWLTGRTRTVDIGDKTPEHVRLVMTTADLRMAFVLCVVLLPLAFAVGGGLLWWWRRRE
jgi:hypothetical protein